MATKNIVPRADGEGGVGTSAKKWGNFWTRKVNGNDPETLLHPRKNSTVYAVGDVAFAASAPSSIALVCVTAGTTAATEPDFSNVAMGDVVTDGAAKWRCQPIVGGDGVPLGMVAPFLQTSIPDGWLSLENGQLVLRTAYPELWAWVQDNAPLITEAQWQTKAAAQKSVGYYSSGDGSTTFRLPRIIGFVEGTTAANVGKFTAAGVPNIEGNYIPTVLSSFANTWTQTGTLYASGSFATKGEVSGSILSYAGATGNVPQSLTFDASRSNPIYGASNTVQPESVGMVWCVRAFGAAVNQGTVDITELAQMLNLKLSIADAPAVCTPFFAPSSTFVDISAYINNTYTAPANGYVAIFGSIASNNGGFAVGTAEMINSTWMYNVSANPLGTGISLPVRKGQQVNISTISNYDVTYVRFIYAVGEEP